MSQPNNDILFYTLKKKNTVVYLLGLTDTDNNINKYNIKNLVNENILKLFELPTAEMEKSLFTKKIF